jgi:predicted PurR-regulated permease PerM
MTDKDNRMSDLRSWFWRWFLNNKVVTALLIILLLLAIIFMLRKVEFIFEPLASFFAAVGAPIIVAGVFYYLLNPLVDWLEATYKVPRLATIIGEFTVLLILIVWGLAVFIPWMRDQIISFLNHWPQYWQALNKALDNLTADDRFKQLNTWLNNTNQDLTTWFKEYSSTFAKKGVSGFGSVIGTVSSVVITILTFPFILFYLLKDGHDLPKYMAKFLPTESRMSFLDTIGEVNSQIANYIRGQLSVAGAVAIMFAIGYTIIGLPYGWLIALTAGLLNMIPFLGSFLAMIPAYLVAVFVSPMMIVYVTIVFMIEQTLEGRLITPKLLGDSLKIHPVTVLVVLLSAGNIFGVLGVVFGIPGYAILKVLISRFFVWWRQNSDLFHDDEDEPNVLG